MRWKVDFSQWCTPAQSHFSPWQNHFPTVTLRSHWACVVRSFKNTLNAGSSTHFQRSVPTGLSLLNTSARPPPTVGRDISHINQTVALLVVLALIFFFLICIFMSKILSLICFFFLTHLTLSCNLSIDVKFVQKIKRFLVLFVFSAASPHPNLAGKPCLKLKIYVKPTSKYYLNKYTLFY